VRGARRGGRASGWAVRRRPSASHMAASTARRDDLRRSSRKVAASGRSWLWATWAKRSGAVPGRRARAGSGWGWWAWVVSMARPMAAVRGGVRPGGVAQRGGPFPGHGFLGGAGGGGFEFLAQELAVAQTQEFLIDPELLGARAEPRLGQCGAFREQLFRIEDELPLTAKVLGESAQPRQHDRGFVGRRGGPRPELRGGSRCGIRSGWGLRVSRATAWR
jgi:hypothetical protein